jgi:hypothetical protein
MREVAEGQDAEDQGVSHRHQRVNAADGEAGDKGLQKHYAVSPGN